MRSIVTAMLLAATMQTQAQIKTNEGISYLMNQPKDMAADFSDLANTYFFALRFTLVMSLVLTTPS